MKYFKKNFVFIFFVIIFLIIAFFYYKEFVFKIFDHRQNLEVYFLDIGQGDSILIKSPYGQNILIDGGPDNKILKYLDKHLSFFNKKIDLMILTHSHDDHVTGLIDVVKRYGVTKIIYTGAIHNGPNYITWLQEVKNKKIPVIVIDRPQKIFFGPDLYFNIFYPFSSFLNKNTDNLNNTSISGILIYRQIRFLLAGDIETEIEKKIIDKNIDLRANVFKVNHHASDTSNSELFLKKINPEIAVISVGNRNNFGHPSPRVLKRLERMKVRAFRTDQDKTINFISDGNLIWQRSP